MIAKDEWPDTGIPECGLQDANSRLVDHVGIDKHKLGRNTKLASRAYKEKLWRLRYNVSSGRDRVNLFGGPSSWITGGTVGRGGSSFRPDVPLPPYDRKWFSQIPKEHRWNVLLPVWQILPPSESTPGARNGWRVPIAISHRLRYLDPLEPGEVAEIGFSWYNWECPFRLQVARDKEFKEIILDQYPATRKPFEPSKKLALGTYYWRIRSEAEGWEGMSGTSPWCETCNFTVVKKVKRERYPSE